MSKEDICVCVCVVWIYIELYKLIEVEIYIDENLEVELSFTDIIFALLGNLGLYAT